MSADGPKTRLGQSTAGSGVDASASPHRSRGRRGRSSVDPRRVVQRPLPPRGADPRTFQISQLQRRFHCSDVDGSRFPISLAPSDPDFPYDIDKLHFALTVPHEYPAASYARPSIRVLNDDVPAGFEANIERGFDSLAAAAAARTGRRTTLLDLINRLDKNLESFLKNESATVLQVVPNKAERALRSFDAGAAEFVPAQSAPPPSRPSTLVTESDPVAQASPEERAAARKKRETELRQLEARLGSSNEFSKAPDGVTYMVPLEPQKKALLPVPLQPIRKVSLIVPLSYNLLPPRIELKMGGVPAEMKQNIEVSWIRQCEENTGFTLMAHLNALASKLHTMVFESRAETKALPVVKPAEEFVTALEPSPVSRVSSAEIKATGKVADKGLENPHIQVIPRPPEWLFPDNGNNEGSSEDSVYSGISDPENEKDGEIEETNSGKNTEETIGGGAAAQSTREHGTSLSYPGIQMAGIQLLESLTLNIIVKCTHCRAEKEVSNLRGTASREVPRSRVDSCDKCARPFGIGFRKELIHASSQRLGFFDLSGCTVAEIRPSDLIPECSGCSTPLPPPGFRGLVVGQGMSANCRNCHQNMTIFLTSAKLLRITSEESGVNLNTLKKVKVKETRMAGTELPARGCCSHYRRSTRWFRFSCCSKVFPCDKCHDEQVEPRHFAEHANRMICGLCSREQNYRPEDCAFCGNQFFRRKTGWWEGGKGTRDRRLMRKNDPRKYKRIGKAL